MAQQEQFEIDWMRLDGVCTSMLYPFQHEGVKFLFERRRCLIADDPGLGKTAQLIFATLWVSAQKVLILCPKTLIHNWKSEIRKWFKEAQIPLAYSKGWGVTNYEKLLNPKWLPHLAQEWDVVIADECHRAFKNHEAARCKNFVKFVYPKAKRIWFSTATISTTSAMDYFPLFKMCQPDKWGKYINFQYKFCHFKPDGTFGGFRNHEELNRGFLDIAIRRKKADVLAELPERTEITLYIEPDHKLLKAKLTEYEYENFYSDAVYIHALGDAKVNVVLELVEDLIPRDESVVFFCWHRSVVEAVAEGAKKRGYTAATIHGGVAVEDRWQIVQDFQDGKISRLAVNVQAGGEGLTLTKASYAVFVELPWSPTPYRQARDRIHRIGTKRNVTIYRMIAQEELGIDQTMLDTLEGRLKHIQRIET